MQKQNFEICRYYDFFCIRDLSTNQFLHNNLSINSTVTSKDGSLTGAFYSKVDAQDILDKYNEKFILRAKDLKVGDKFSIVKGVGNNRYQKLNIDLDIFLQYIKDYPIVVLDLNNLEITSIRENYEVQIEDS